MATRGGRVLLRNLSAVSLRRRLVSSTPSPLTAAVTPLSFGADPSSPAADPSVPAAVHPSGGAVNFDDAKALFSTVSSPRLLRSWLTLQATAVEPLVDLGLWVMTSRLVETPVVKQLIVGAVRHTFFDHFCAGRDLEEAGRTITRLRDAGLSGMLDYGLEHATDNASCDRNALEFIRTADFTKSLPPSAASFVVVKITAICPLSLLRRVSDLLRWEYQDNALHLPWKRDCLPIFADSSPFYHTQKKPEPLTAEEEQDLKLTHERLFKICEKCVECNIPLVIDAEDTTLQPAIDYFAYSSAMEYRTDRDPLIYVTIQAYLKDSKDRMVKTKKFADEIGVSVGFKLVRGAYMSSERQTAAFFGMESPIQNSIQETHANYDDCTSFLLEEVARGSGSVVLASHNPDSGKMAAAKATDLGIHKDNRNLQFAQLYGMADTLSFGLRNAGFRVSKYLPFGPVEQIMPYLLRRAEENRGLLASSNLDRVLMRNELKRRCKSF